MRPPSLAAQRTDQDTVRPAILTVDQEAYFVLPGDNDRSDVRRCTIPIR